MRNLDPVGHAARGPAHVKAKRQQKQHTAQASSVSAPIRSSGSDSNPNPIHTPTQTVPLHLPSGSLPRSQLHPVPLPPLPDSAAMEMNGDEDSSGTDPHSNSSHTEIPDQPNVLPTPILIQTDPRLLHDTPFPRPSKAVVSQSMVAALGILRDIAPQMSALTRILDGLDANNETLDVQMHSLVTEGMEAAALLERQLARVASKAQCSRP